MRAAWISDLDLGTLGGQAAALLEFLRELACETLHLVRDVIDGWQLRRSWYWPQAHNDVVQKILRKARKGTCVVFVPGNHDEFARRCAKRNVRILHAARDAAATRRVPLAGRLVHIV